MKENCFWRDVFVWSRILWRWRAINQQSFSYFVGADQRLFQIPRGFWAL